MNGSIVERLRDYSVRERPLRDEAADTIEELAGALTAMVDEQCDYMRLNMLGDAEKQHTVKQARAALAKVNGLASPEGGE